MLLIGCAPGVADYMYEINDQCSLNRANVHTIEISCMNEVRIERKVYELSWNKRFVFAKTNPVTVRKYPESSKNNYKIPDYKTTYWWIIDLLDQAQYGPFETEDDFLTKLKSLSYNNEIEWTSVNTFRKQEK